MSERKITKGPPPKDGVRRANWTTRLRHDLRAKLMAEAESRNLSMSEVVEDIIKAHFDQPALIDALADRLEKRQRQSTSVDFQDSGAAQLNEARKQQLAAAEKFTLESYRDIYGYKD